MNTPQTAFPLDSTPSNAAGKVEGAEMGKIAWKGMETAPRDGTPFIWLSWITILDTPIRYEPRCEIIYRNFKIGDRTVKIGHWMGRYNSRSDLDLAHGCWMPLPESPTL